MSASVARLDGVLAADLNFASGTLLVEYDSVTDPRAQIEKTVAATGHGVQSLEDVAAGVEPAERSWLDRNRSEVATAGAGAFTALGAVALWIGMPETVANAAFAVAIGFGGLLVWRRALVSLKAHILDMNVLMSVAVIGAAALGEWGEGATVFFLFALGGLLESRSLERTRRSIRDLMDLTPPTARVFREPVFVQTPLEAVVVGDRVLVRPGERVPVDGVIAEGASALDEAAITGESTPVEKAVGGEVFAGTLNTTGLLEVNVTAVAADSTLARIVYLVEEAQASRAPSQRFIDRFSLIYTPAVIGLALAVAVVPTVLSVVLTGTLGAWTEWIRRSLVMLVVSCPCALVISTPVAIVSGITRASRDGVLVKGGGFLEAAARVKAVAFDKTGTLTRGTPTVAEVTGLGGMEAAQVLAAASALESHSNHPLARAIVAASGSSPQPEALADYRETPGIGVSGVLEGVEWEVCSPSRAEDLGALDLQAFEQIERMESLGRTALVLLRAGQAVGVMGIADSARPEAAAIIGRLREGGVEHLVMLTGDNERVAEAVVQEVGLTGYLARLLPETKTDAVRTLQERYDTVAMVGDGVNDAPALAAADIGIAMGAAGTDTALETADVALMRDDLSALPGFFALGRRTMRTIVVNVTFSIAVKAVFLVLALTGTATLWMAVFADTGVSLLVILNGMRLLRPGASRA